MIVEGYVVCGCVLALALVAYWQARRIDNLERRAVVLSLALASTLPEVDPLRGAEGIQKALGERAVLVAESLADF
jgi:hypothetical protein